MRPHIIMHNTVSIDGSISGFPVDLELHYATAADFRPDAHLIAAHTVHSGMESAHLPLPDEVEADLTPNPPRDAPRWIIPDHHGILHGKLHVFRRFERCGGVLVVVSSHTPRAYVNYLRERDYPIITAGRDRVDLRRTITLLGEEHGVARLLVDSGAALGAQLLDMGLIDEVSLVIAPHLVGRDSLALFSAMAIPAALTLKHVHRVGPGDQLLHLIYRVSA